MHVCGLTMVPGGPTRPWGPSWPGKPWEGQEHTWSYGRAAESAWRATAHVKDTLPAILEARHVLQALESREHPKGTWDDFQTLSRQTESEGEQWVIYLQPWRTGVTLLSCLSRSPLQNISYSTWNILIHSFSTWCFTEILCLQSKQTSRGSDPNNSNHAFIMKLFIFHQTLWHFVVDQRFRSTQQ